MKLYSNININLSVWENEFSSNNDLCISKLFRFTKIVNHVFTAHFAFTFLKDSQEAEQQRWLYICLIEEINKFYQSCVEGGNSGLFAVSDELVEQSNSIFNFLEANSTVNQVFDKFYNHPIDSAEEFDIKEVLTVKSFVYDLLSLTLQEVLEQIHAYGKESGVTSAIFKTTGLNENASPITAEN